MSKTPITDAQYAELSALLDDGEISYDDALISMRDKSIELELKYEKLLAGNKALDFAYWDERERRQRISEAYVILEHQNAELLEVLELVTRSFAYSPGSKSEPEWYAKARSAITKAKGGAS